MDMQIGSLPDDHAFFRVRVIVDWSFKVIAWLGVTATFQIAADATGGTIFRALWFISLLLIFFYLQTLIEWLLEFKRSGQSPKNHRVLPAVGVRKLIWRLKGLASYVISFVIVWTLKLGMQSVVQIVVATIVEYQKRAIH